MIRHLTDRMNGFLKTSLQLPLSLSGSYLHILSGMLIYSREIVNYIKKKERGSDPVQNWNMFLLLSSLLVLTILSH